MRRTKPDTENIAIYAEKRKPNSDSQSRRNIVRPHDRDFYEPQGEGWEREDPMDYRPDYYGTCSVCHEPSEMELTDMDGKEVCDPCFHDEIQEQIKAVSERRQVTAYMYESIKGPVDRCNAILSRWGLDPNMAWCNNCEKPTEHYDFQLSYTNDIYNGTACAICDYDNHHVDFVSNLYDREPLGDVEDPIDIVLDE